MVQVNKYRKFWDEMGISGKKNELKSWFTHVTDSSRKIFVFSDTPHLEKTIRNRVYANDLKILSNSVAKGLRFYSLYNHELKDSTAEFCEWMNSLFDALNRREYHNGLKPGNADFLFLQNALEKLDQWKNLMEQGLITSKEFLT